MDSRLRALLSGENLWVTSGSVNSVRNLSLLPLWRGKVRMGVAVKSFSNFDYLSP